MGMTLAQRLEQAFAGADVGYRLFEAAGAPVRGKRPVSPWGKSLDFYDPIDSQVRYDAEQGGLVYRDDDGKYKLFSKGGEEGASGSYGRHLDDLAYTRFPAGIPVDEVPRLRRLGVEIENHPARPDGTIPICLIVSGQKPDDMEDDEWRKMGVKNNKHTRLADLKFDDIVDVGPAWTKAEIANALWPMISSSVRAYTAGGWNRTNDSFDREAASDLTQMARLAVMRAIESQEDRGDYYLGWVKRRMNSMISAGTVSDAPSKAAAGFYGDLVRCKSPAAVDALINKPGVDRYGRPLALQEVDRTEPRKPREGNRYGEFAPDLFASAIALRNALGRAASKDAEEKRTGAEEVKKELAGIAEKHQAIGEHGRLLGARTGLYDTISTSHSDSYRSRYAVKLGRAETPEQLAKLGPPKGKDKDLIALHQKYSEAMAAGDKNALDDIRTEIRQFLHQQGDRDAFRATAGRMNSLTVNAGKNGEKNAESPHAPFTTDKGPEDMANTEINVALVKKLLQAGLDGKVIGRRKDNNEDLKQLTTRDFRLIIRQYGISDYPHRSTPDNHDPKDPEIDRKKEEEIYDQLIAGMENPSAETAYRLQPASRAEAEYFIDYMARFAATYGGNEIAQHTYEDEKANLEDYLKEKGVILVFAKDEDDAAALATRFATSKWVRNGCPQLSLAQIHDELGFNDKGVRTGQKTTTDAARDAMDKKFRPIAKSMLDPKAIAREFIGKLMAARNANEVKAILPLSVNIEDADYMNELREEYFLALKDGNKRKMGRLKDEMWQYAEELKGVSADPHLADVAGLNKPAPKPSGVAPPKPSGPADRPEDDPKVEWRRQVEMQIMAESAYSKLWHLANHYVNAALVTEALDRVDMALLRDTRDKIGNYLMDIKYGRKCK